ncbi:tRNA (adenosine(37)-N6)-dimethylallyltransferase MiaA [Arthrobacter agilis]|uniref:tRNA (adenosine(37)-N6)-dimethylallyltransferase MiaA n=1 Tax=Arthrobacter agilis TaxID=37921 RepID=UPI000B34CD2E|nr:tRNA (adenosine(37)-N6)-dimethylallyltransferase MiaA [Arthrobacter agilis]PPB44958.1 tRNA (adenosine(37)-N6)-dimethylallyltransferase MiaA [Arthrobacter agilis]TPV27663.1 tRNA (adenosine(37)-N6)-dimethylallyltransferase MiaA [Arthrobacter agilis]WDF34418.1 tRNA (adenosine(37)-N6)-dimethylallyltransferase MiaA [Arthrobacter agilis]VDR31708.1 tRNA dimethylallyltransferase [Arthrobacter agilis]
MTLPVVAVVGPTGVGKSDLAVSLAEQLRGEIINADALQLYRGMDIGTAKLDVEARRGIEHHLLDVLDVTDEASVAAYQEDARRCIDDIRSRGRLPILVGGSGLYLRAVLDRLEFPPTDPTVRAGLEAELAESGSPSFRERLRLVDPVSAERITDDRRLVRALEVHAITGRPFSAFMPTREYHRPAVQIGLGLDREILRERLSARVHAMVSGGLRHEVEQLAAIGLREGRTASRALGYAQFLQVIDGTMTAADAVEDTIGATRRFAKRQLTWFRGDSRVRWLDGRMPGLAEAAVGLVHGHGDLS